jgi:hypothetical protein
MTTTNEKQTTIRLGNRETTWSDLLRDAVSIPGKLLEAYTAFHNFSVGNSLLALFQCYERDVTPGPLNTYKGWQQLGRQVRKGEKATSEARCRQRLEALLLAQGSQSCPWQHDPSLSEPLRGNCVSASWLPTPQNPPALPLRCRERHDRGRWDPYQCTSAATRESRCAAQR